MKIFLDINKIKPELMSDNKSKIIYTKTSFLLNELFKKKKNSIKEKNKFIRNGKIAKYLQQKGFENNLIWELINNDK